MIRYIGKETNKLDEREGGLLRNMDEALTDYPLPVTSDDSWPDVLTVLATMPHADVARDVAIDARSLRKLISGERYPGPKLRDQLTLMVRAHARQTLGGEGEANSAFSRNVCATLRKCVSGAGNR